MSPAALGATTSSSAASSSTAAPYVTVLRGRPTPEELVALVAALSLLHRHTTEPPPSLSHWGDRADAVRSPVSARPGAWRATAWSR